MLVFPARKAPRAAFSEAWQPETAQAAKSVDEGDTGLGADGEFAPEHAGRRNRRRKHRLVVAHQQREDGRAKAARGLPEIGGNRIGRKPEADQEGERSSRRTEEAAGSCEAAHLVPVGRRGGAREE